MSKSDLEGYTVIDRLIVIEQNKYEEPYTVVLIGDKIDKDIKVGDNLVIRNDATIYISFKIESQKYMVIDTSSILMIKKNNSIDNN